MTFCEYLKENYGVNEPIYIENIQFKDYSRPWIFKELKKLTESGELKRFDTGIYYFPIKMFYGEGALSARKVVKRRFLTDGKDVYGYISGLSLLNQTGISPQVPNLMELVTNNESTRVRDIYIGNQRVRAHRGRTTITKENYLSLQFLDLMNSISPKGMDETERFMLSKYIKETGISKESVLQYVELFPAKTSKNMMVSGAAYELT